MSTNQLIVVLLIRLRKISNAKANTDVKVKESAIIKNSFVYIRFHSCHNIKQNRNGDTVF